MKYPYLLLLAVPTSLFSTVTIDVQMGAFFEAGGADAPLNSYAVLVADTGTDGFLGEYTSALDANFNVFDGTTLAIGNTIGGSSNDEIIGVFQMVDLGGFSGITGSLSGIDFTIGDLNSNQELAVFWFPTVTVGSISGSLSEYGYYRSDIVDTNAGSDIAFIMPSDGSNVNLFTFTSNIDSSDPTIADLTAVAVPEPSHYAAVVGLLGLGLVMWRRRRS